MARQLFWLFLFALTTPAYGQELLVNRSFELPAAPAPGNNFYATIPNWTVVNLSPAQARPFNIILAHAGYPNNPTATPTGGGAQYLDINTAEGTIRQNFTLSAPGVVSFSGWYSIRDFPQALAGMTVTIRNAGGSAVSSGSISFTAAEPIGLWKQVLVTGVGLAAGSYTYEAAIPNFANFDLASVALQPTTTFSKTSAIYWDPGNQFTNPKAIPGGLITYTITTANPAYSLTSGSISVIDVTPPQLALVVTDFGVAASGPAAFDAGASGLTYSFAGLTSMTDGIDFSNDGGATWTYVPVAGLGGADPAVSAVRITPSNAMTASSSFSVLLRYRIK